jgi:mannitol 2-dehydrogenase
MTPEAYIALIKQRFSNPHIVDTTRRVAFDGSSRHPGFIIPSIRTGLARDTPVDGLTFVSAVWARMCEGKREDGSRIEPNDPVWDDLQLAAKAARRNPNVWLSQDQYYGDLSTQPRFVNAFDKWLKMIWAVGLEAAMESYLES